MEMNVIINLLIVKCGRFCMYCVSSIWALDFPTWRKGEPSALCMHCNENTLTRGLANLTARVFKNELRQNQLHTKTKHRRTDGRTVGRFHEHKSNTTPSIYRPRQLRVKPEVTKNIQSAVMWWICFRNYGMSPGQDRGWVWDPVRCEPSGSLPVHLPSPAADNSLCSSENRHCVIESTWKWV